MFLFIDTETTGLIDFSLPVVHPSQPRLVQIAAWLGENDEYGVCEHVRSLNAVIRPDGWEVPAAASKIHGITTEYARSFGETLTDVITRLCEMLDTADKAVHGEGRLIAHNLSFDHRILMSEILRCNRDASALNLLSPFCTMRSLTKRMRLPGKYPGKFKWPNLDEAYNFCFDAPIPYEGRHTAMADLLACKDVFFHGRAMEWWR